MKRFLSILLIAASAFFVGAWTHGIGGGSFISLVAPLNGTTISGSSVNLIATVNFVGTIKNVQFKVDGSSVASPITSAPFAATFDSTGLVDGNHTITANSTDTFGNVSSYSSTVIVNNTTLNVNIVSSPNDFSTWTTAHLTSTNAAKIDPVGGNTGISLVEDNTANLHNIFKAFTIPAHTSPKTYKFSIAGWGNPISGSGTGARQVSINLSDSGGSATASCDLGGGISSAKSGTWSLIIALTDPLPPSTNLGGTSNAYWVCIVTATTPTNSTSLTAKISISNPNAGGTFYTGDGSSGLWIAETSLVEVDPNFNTVVTPAVSMINTHTAEGTKPVPPANNVSSTLAIGASAVRLDINWQSLETSPGVYSFTTVYDPTVNAYIASGITSFMFNLAYCHTVYCGGVFPNSSITGNVLTVGSITGSGSVILGGQITGTGIPNPNPKINIVNQLSGTPGGVGTYTVAGDPSSPLSSRTLTQPGGISFTGSLIASSGVGNTVMTVTAVGSGSIVVGTSAADVLSGTGVASGTTWRSYVTSQLSGTTGGIGTYAVQVLFDGTGSETITQGGNFFGIAYGASQTNYINYAVAVAHKYCPLLTRCVIEVMNEPNLFTWTLNDPVPSVFASLLGPVANAVHADATTFGYSVQVVSGGVSPGPGYDGNSYMQVIANTADLSNVDGFGIHSYNESPLYQPEHTILDTQLFKQSTLNLKPIYQTENGYSEINQGILTTQNGRAILQSRVNLSNFFVSGVTQQALYDLFNIQVSNSANNWGVFDFNFNPLAGSTAYAALTTAINATSSKWSVLTDETQNLWAAIASGSSGAKAFVWNTGQNVTVPSLNFGIPSNPNSVTISDVFGNSVTPIFDGSGNLIVSPIVANGPLIVTLPN